MHVFDGYRLAVIEYDILINVFQIGVSFDR